MKKSPKKNTIEELSKELDVFDTMLSTLVELLEQKRMLTQKEYESNANIEKISKKKSFRDLT